MAMLVLALVLMIATYASPVEAQTTLTAANCTYVEVNSKVTSAVSGDTVIVPGGTCSWASRLVVGSKSITLQGAGAGTEAQCGAVGSQSTYTCIIMDSASTFGLISWTLIPTGNPRITGFTFDGGSIGSAGVDTNGLISINGNSANWRFDNNRVLSRRLHGMMFHGYVRGVNDHVTIERRDGHFGFYVHHGNWGGGVNTCPNFGNGCGDASWNAATNFGSSGFLFFEDCTFDRVAGASLYATDGWIGQRMVVRFCNINNSVVTDHGTDSSGRQRGARAKEVYGNAIRVDAIASISGAISARGGTAMWWGNQGTSANGFTLTNLTNATFYRHSSNPSGAECDHWYCADNTALITPTSSTTDWNTGQAGSGGIRANSFDSSGTGYPAMDQVGRGQGDLITGDRFSGPGVLPVGWPNQAAEPIYGWDNDINGVNSPIATNGFGLATFVQENREYYTEGSLNGVKGSGARSARPATCTTGEAYWSTDGGGNWNTSTSNPFGVQRNGADGGLDKCTAPNTWTNDWYVPYTYPHPLNSSTTPSQDTTPPAAPTGVQVTER